MELIEKYSRYRLLTKRFKVSTDSIDKEGSLSVCKLLNEMTKLNDQAIKKVFGGLNYDHLSTSHYDVDFIDNAALGDTVEIQSQYTATNNDSLLIDIVVRKLDTIRTTIGEARFVFRSNLNKVAVLSV